MTGKQAASLISQAEQTESATGDKGSFRDRTNQIVYQNGRVLRLLTEEGKRNWQSLRSSQLFAREVGRKLIETSESPLPPLPNKNGWVAALEHKMIPVISYPYEWCFGMLKDAALLQLELLHEALGQGLTIKDASAYNVQWLGASPVFIDIGSFESYQRGSAWRAYNQFCRLFLFPLLLQGYRGIDFRPFLSYSLDGIDIQTMSKIFASPLTWRRGVFTHVILHSLLEAKTAGINPNQTSHNFFNEKIIQRNVSKLRAIISSLSLPAVKTTWGDYADSTPSYTTEEQDAKRSFISQVVAQRNRELVVDLGSNTGVFAEIAAKNSNYVIAADFDHLAIEKGYQRLKLGDAKNILPLIINLSQPSPAIGWRNTERRSFFERIRPDLTFCLALIHHLVLGNNIPLSSVVEMLAELGGELVIEFVSKADKMSQIILQSRLDQHFDYDQAHFEDVLRKFYRIEHTQPLLGGNRILYHCIRNS